MIFSNYFLNFTHFIFSHFASFVTVALISSFHSVSPQLEYYFDIHIIHSRNFLFSPSRLISAEIINVFLYPWNFSFNCIGPDYIHNPFRHFDQDLVTPYTFTHAHLFAVSFSIIDAHSCNTSLWCTHYAGTRSQISTLLMRTSYTAPLTLMIV